MLKVKVLCECVLKSWLQISPLFVQGYVPYSFKLQGYIAFDMSCHLSIYNSPLYPVLSTGSSQEDWSQHDWKNVDWDKKNQIK